MQERIASGPDRFTLVSGFADIQEITFYIGGAHPSPKKVIIETMSHRGDLINSFNIEGYFVQDKKKFTGYYEAANQKGQLEW
jgi:hypothetical protein